MNIETTLRSAAEIMSDLGWTRGHLMDHKTGAVCARGALWLALGRGLQQPDGCTTTKPWFRLAYSYSEEDAAAYTEIARALDSYLLHIMPGLEWSGAPAVVFNDELAHEARDVIGLLRAAADHYATPAYVAALTEELVPA